MQPDDAPPRLHWRLLSWLTGALLLLPVLYVAASGPVWWRNHHYYRTPEWVNRYFETLDPLIYQPQLYPMFVKYQDWWTGLPPPRPWRRQYLAGMLTTFRAAVESIRKNNAEKEGQLAALQLRLDALDSRTDLTPEQSSEAIKLRSEIAELQKYLKSHGRPVLLRYEQSVQETEDALREFDRGKR